MINYWCIDDDCSTAASGIELINASSSGALQVTLKEPKTLKDILSDVARDKPDGLILDLRLDEVPSKEKYIADYRAGTLAQQLRSLAIEQGIVDIPIVLWSSEPNLRKSYVNDVLSHGLFDHVYVKNRVVDNPSKVASELIAFAKGYKEIAEQLRNPAIKLTELLRVDGASAEFIESIVLSATSWDKLRLSTSSLARWILRRLMRSPGPLIDEKVLAARLGVSIDNSPGWAELLKKYFIQADYRGPFAELMPRWWALNVERWWMAQKPPAPLSLLAAEDRIAFLKEKFGIESLKVAENPGKTSSTFFWYVCEKTYVPLDPKDGLAMIDEDLESWNEPQLVSIEYALGDSRVPLQPNEKQRLQLIKSARSK